MCCLRISTEVLLANLFAAVDTFNADAKQVFSYDDLKAYLVFLKERFPVYIVDDFWSGAVKQCIDDHPDLYHQLKPSRDEILIEAGKLCPNLDYFNANFPAGVSSYIQNLTRVYLEDLNKLKA